MISENFTVDDIHELRIQLADHYNSIPKEEAEKEFKKHAENTRKAIEEIRKAKNIILSK